MTADRSAMVWMENDEWYRINYEKNCFELTDKAPEEAKESFELYKKINNIKGESDFAKTYFK